MTWGASMDPKPELPELEKAYLDGVEDVADKVIELIYQSDYTITLQEVIDFLEAEKEAPL